MSSLLTKFIRIKAHKQFFQFSSFSKLHKESQVDPCDKVLSEDREYQDFTETFFKVDKARNCYIIQPYVKWGPQKLQDITPLDQLDEAKALVETLTGCSLLKKDTNSTRNAKKQKKEYHRFQRNTTYGRGSRDATSGKYLQKFVKFVYRDSLNPSAFITSVGSKGFTPLVANAGKIGWSVEKTISVPLETVEENTLFKSGNLEKLKQEIRGAHNINTVFVNLGTLKKAQSKFLEREFGTPVLDRYKIVMQILKMHATSKHAKLQVALAELYYIQRNAIGEMHAFMRGDKEKVRLMFQSREQKIKTAINDLRKQRSLLRTKRRKSNFPVVAVVGYTNAGKTSIIKALTGEEALQPRNQLFATLDVTMHSGMLPSGLDVLYVDTVGFISDIPTNLIECFVATLEDALLADVILHVEDISSSNYEFKRKHVLKTLQDLSQKTGGEDIERKIISAGNKSDIAPRDQDFGILRVSAKTDVGLDVLRMELESKIIELTNRRKIKIRIPTGGEEVRWLYKNATVVAELPDEEVDNATLVEVIITNGKLQQFRHYYAT